MGLSGSLKGELLVKWSELEPKQIWDDALEFEAYVTLHISLDSYMIQVEWPETVMFGGSSDISQFW